MKVAGAMYIEWTEDEAVVLNRDSGELHYLNGVAALVLALIEEHGLDGGLHEVRRRFGSTEEVERDLAELVSDMRENGILVDDEPTAIAGAPDRGDAAPDQPGEPRAAAG